MSEEIGMQDALSCPRHFKKGVRSDNRVGKLGLSVKSQLECDAAVAAKAVDVQEEESSVVERR